MPHEEKGTIKKKSGAFERVPTVGTREKGGDQLMATQV